MAAVAALKNQKQISQKDEGIAPVGSIAAVTAAAVSWKQNNQAEYPEEFNEEDSVPPVGRGIAAMAAVTARKNQNNHSQKDDGVLHQVVKQL